MPNHVHVLMHCCFGTSLGEIVRSWKTFTARKINELAETGGQLWAVDYYDRYIRDLDHLADARAYIRNNPVKVGLCKKPEDWPWSSAGIRKDRESPDSPAQE
jgi:putative DNA methylase